MIIARTKKRGRPSGPNADVRVPVIPHARMRNLELRFLVAAMLIAGESSSVIVRRLNKAYGARLTPEKVKAFWDRGCPLL
jgi:hypothetical protein